MPPKKWGPELNVKFVEAYKEKECLWNQFDPLYKNKFARETALRKLSDELQLDDFGVAEVKAKIKSLRSTYNLEVEKQKKSEQSGTGSADVYVPSLKWFDTMKEIMSKGTQKRQACSNLNPVDHDYESDLDHVGEPVNFGGTSPEVQNVRQNDDPQQLRPKKKFKLSSKIHQIASTSRQHLNDSLTDSAEPNEWVIFGNLVAAHLQKLSPLRALEAEMRILAVLNECRMQDLMAQSLH